MYAYTFRVWYHGYNCCSCTIINIIIYRSRAHTHARIPVSTFAVGVRLL